MTDGGTDGETLKELKINNKLRIGTEDSKPTPNRQQWFQSPQAQNGNKRQELD